MAVKVPGEAGAEAAPQKIFGKVLPDWASRPLEFSWGCEPSEFSRRMSRFEEALNDPEAKIVEISKLGDDFSNPVSLVKLSNGLVGVWKTEHSLGERNLRRNVPVKEEFRREALAYEVDKTMGHLGRVPPAVFREINGVRGVLQLFVPRTQMALKSEYKLEPGQERYEDLAVYDHALGNSDRHDLNWLFTEDGSVVPIDHGLTLPENNSCPGSHNFYLHQKVFLKDRHLGALRKLQDGAGELRKRADELKLDPGCIDAMLERTGVMLLSRQTSNFWRGGDDFPTTLAAGDKYLRSL